MFSWLARFAESTPRGSVEQVGDNANQNGLTPPRDHDPGLGPVAMNMPSACQRLRRAALKLQAKRPFCARLNLPEPCDSQALLVQKGRHVEMHRSLFLPYNRQFGNPDPDAARTKTPHHMDKKSWGCPEQCQFCVFDRAEMIFFANDAGQLTAWIAIPRKTASASRPGEKSQRRGVITPADKTSPAFSPPRLAASKPTTSAPPRSAKG